jgi:endonuclease/exonuclease/phosphatase (EEP) superfamily protein YafD
MSDSMSQAKHPSRRAARRAWSRVRASLHDVIGASIAFYGVCTALYVLMHFGIGERLAVVAFLNNFMPLLLLPAPVLLLAHLPFRRWRLVLVLLPAALMFGLSYGAFFTPNRVHAGRDTVPMTVLTYNLHSEREALTPMADVIGNANADVVALQELSPEAARAFVEAYGERYPYRALHPAPFHNVRGQGVLSRYPILEDSYWVADLGQQRVVLDVGGTRVTLYNVHPPHPFVATEKGMRVDVRRRSGVTDDILRRAASDTAPVILAGDFNMTDQTEVYAHVAAWYRDTYREVGWGLGFTFPEPLDSGLRSLVPPLARIDYIFHDETVLSLAARVWPTSGGSDHHPVWVQLAIPSQ